MKIRLKAIVRFLLQMLSRIILPKLSVSNEYEYSLLGGRSHYFVGYYDIDPISQDSKYLLCHKISDRYTKHTEPEKGVIGLFEIQTGEFIEVSKTRALNWQLGSRVQWLSENTIIYNDIINGKQCSIIYNVKNKAIEKKHHRPFWAVSPNKKYAVSLNFSSLSKNRPGYGYKGESPDYNKEVVTVFDIANGDVMYQTDIKSLLSELNFHCPEGIVPYFNHVTWSPCSNKFITLFLFENEATRKRFSYPVLVDCKTNSVSLFHSEGLFSHHVWISPKSLLAFLKLDGFNTFAIWSQNKGWENTHTNMPKLDGHPSVGLSDGAIVVDSYPDRFGRMKLYLGSLKVMELKKIGTFINGKEFVGALRCDLHPRVSIKDKYVICDIPNGELRKILLIKGCDE